VRLCVRTGAWTLPTCMENLISIFRKCITLRNNEELYRLNQFEFELLACVVDDLVCFRVCQLHKLKTLS
jgi:hypothetical protein